MPKIHRRGLARFAAYYCDEQVFNMEQANRYLEAARGLGFQLNIHTGPQAGRTWEWAWRWPKRLSARTIWTSSTGAT